MKDINWSYKSLSNLCEINIGKTPSRSKPEYWGSGFAWVSISDLKEKYISKTKEEITKAAIAESNCKIVKKGTLLMSFKLSIGKLAFAEKDLYTNEAIVALPIKDETELSKEYLYYVLKFIPLVGGNQAAMGKTLNKQSLSVLQIPLPPSLNDQKCIAKILSQCEALIQKRKESIDLLDELLKSTFLEMFGDESKFKSMSVEEIASDEKYSLSSGPFGSNLTSEHYTKEGVIILRGKNISSGKLDLSDIKYVSEEKGYELRRSAIKPNDIVIVAVGSSGAALKIPEELPYAIMSQNFNKITPNLELVLPIYLEFSINSQIVQRQFRRVMTDAGRTFLGLTKIKEIKIPVPDKDEQLKFEQTVLKIEALKDKFNDSLQELENLYGSVSQRAFNSQLDLSKIDISNMEDYSKKKADAMNEDTSKENVESFKSNAELLGIVSENKEYSTYLSENAQLYINKSKDLRTRVYLSSKIGEINIADFRDELKKLNKIGEELIAEVKDYTVWKIDQHKPVERYISLLPENILVEYPNINIFSRNQFDYSSMTLDDYLGIPDDIIEQYGSIENQIVDIEFFFKKYFSNQSFTIQDVERVCNKVVYERGDWFKYEEMKDFVFKSLEGENAFFTQTFEEIEISDNESTNTKAIKRVMLKVIS